MKIFKRIMLGLAATFAGLAIVCFVAAFCMGLTPQKFEEMMFDNTFHYASVGGKLTFMDPDNFVGGEGHDVLEKNFANIEIDYTYGELELFYGDVETIEVHYKDVRNLGYSWGENNIHIEGGPSEDIEDNFEPKLTIILPYGTVYENITIKLGGCQAKIDGLLADKVVIEMDAGQTESADIVAERLEVIVGAGQANFTNLAVGDLEMEVGVGEADVQLCGCESDYNYDIECGIGEVVVGNKSYGGMGAEQNISNPGANCKMDIECGIGQVCVKFNESKSDAVNCTDENCQIKWHHHNNHGNGHHDE